MVTRANSRWRIHAAYLAVLSCAVVLTWFCVDTLASFRQIALKNQVRGISRLMDEYVQCRDRTGEWPAAEELYGDEFALQGSEQSGDARIDTFFVPRGVMVQFRLKDNGLISFDVTWDKYPREVKASAE